MRATRPGTALIPFFTRVLRQTFFLDSSIALFERFLLSQKPEEDQQKEGSRKDIEKPTDLFAGYFLYHDQDSGPEEGHACDQDHESENISGCSFHDP